MAVRVVHMSAIPRGDSVCAGRVREAAAGGSQGPVWADSHGRVAAAAGACFLLRLRLLKSAHAKTHWANT